MDSKTMPAIKKYLVAMYKENAEAKDAATKEMTAAFAGLNPIEVIAEMGMLKKLGKEIDAAENKEEILEQWARELDEAEKEMEQE